MKLSEVKGKTVVATAEAMKVGTVSDIVINSKYKFIEALVVKTDERVPDKVVKSNKILSIGQDVVTIDSTRSLQVFDQEQDLLRLPRATAMQNSRIVTESGKILGTVHDVEFEPTTGQIHSFDYDGGPLGGLIGQRQKLDPKYVISFGEGLVTVTDEALPSARAV